MASAVPVELELQLDPGCLRKSCIGTSTPNRYLAKVYSIPHISILVCTCICQVHTLAKADPKVNAIQWFYLAGVNG